MRAIENEEPAIGLRQAATASLRAALVWTIAAAAIVLWLVGSYRWLAYQLGEWQFDRFGKFYPALTFLAFVLVACVPIALVWLARRRRRRTADAADAATIHDHRREERAIWRLRLFAWVVAGVAALLALGAWLTLPSARSGDPVEITAGRAIPESPSWGVLRGDYRLGRTAYFDEDLLFVRRRLLVAPVVFEGAGARSAPPLFTVVEPLAGNRGFVSIGRGLIVPGGVPRELLPLYASERAGPVALLMRDEEEAGWRRRMFGWQSAIVALIGLLAALGAGRHLKRIRARATDPQAPST